MVILAWSVFTWRYTFPSPVWNKNTSKCPHLQQEGPEDPKEKNKEGMQGYWNLPEQKQ